MRSHPNENNSEVRGECLADGVVVYTSENHRFGTDAILLANFAHPRRMDAVCDLGTGCGIIPLVMCKRFSPSRITAVELQAEAVELFHRSIEESTLATPITILHQTLVGMTIADVGNASFDVITCNPPYKVTGTGIMSESDSDKLARHETACTIEDVCSTAGRVLRFGGRLCICQRPERLPDVMGSMRRNKIEPKRLRMVAKDATGAPWLILVEGVRGGKPFLQVEPQLNIYENGKYTAEVASMYELDK